MRRFLLLSALTACAAFSVACDDDGPGTNSVEPDASADECEGLADGTACGVGQVCLDETCQASICGDGYVDPAQGEECDDGNLVDGDGCDNDCTLSCHSDEDCSDENACNGFETCVDFGALKRCQDGTPPDCGPPDEPKACTEYVCEATAETLEDACLVITEVFCHPDVDGDGFPDPDPEASVLPVGMCDCPEGYMKQRGDSLWDCNDNTPDVRPTASGAQPASFQPRPYCEDGQFAKVDETIDCPRDAPKNAECYSFVCEDGSKPSFDYDCNKKIDVQAKQIAEAECTPFRNACVGEGWIDWTPTCGSESPTLECDPANKCDAIRPPPARTQRCR